MNLRHKLIIPSADLAIGICGVYLGTYQISLLQITQNFHLDTVMMGVLVAIQYVGLCLPPLFLGTLSEKIGKKGVVTISLPLMILGVLLISLTNNLGLFIAGILLCGAGYSVAEATLTATLGVEFKEKSAFHLGMSQAFFSIGAVLAPFWCEALFSAGFTYHHAFGIVGIALIVTYILFLFTRHENDIRGAAQSGIGSALRFFTKKAFLLIAVAMFMAIGIEETVAFYADSYLELTLGVPQFSALALSLFWAGMIPPRIFLGFIKLPHKTLFTICGLGITASALGIIFIPILPVRLVLFALLGVFNGPTWPIIMDITAKKYPGNAGAVTNIMMSLGCLGGAITPLIAGALVVGINFVPILIATAFCGVIMSIAFAASDKKFKTHKST
jgi:putative MFS transporter